MRYFVSFSISQIFHQILYSNATFISMPPQFYLIMVTHTSINIHDQIAPWQLISYPQPLFSNIIQIINPYFTIVDYILWRYNSYNTNDSSYLSFFIYSLLRLTEFLTSSCLAILFSLYYSNLSFQNYTNFYRDIPS